MSSYSGEYEDIDDVLARVEESIYLNPVFDDHDETKTAILLLNHATNENRSTYVEVATNVSDKDQPEMPCLTLRSVLIGMMLTCLVSFTSQFFALRTSPIEIHVGIVILLSYMIGRLISKILPERINPGPLTVKEHALITMMATSGSSTIYAMESIIIQRRYYHFYLSHFNAEVAATHLSKSGKQTG